MNTATRLRAGAVALTTLLLAVITLGWAAITPVGAFAASERVPSATLRQLVGDPDSLTAPSTSGVCAADSPIKGVSTEEGEHFYYVPGHPLYEGTVPERCFANEAAARSAGYTLRS